MDIGIEYEKEIIDDFNKILHNGSGDEASKYVDHIHLFFSSKAVYLTIDNLKFLLENGNKFNMDYIITYYLYHNKFDTIEYLVSNYNISFDNLKKIMLYAIEKKSFDKIIFLIDHGYDLYVNNDFILEKVINDRDKELLDYFLAKGLVITDNVIRHGFFSYKFDKNNDEYIQLLIDIGIDVDRIANLYFKSLIHLKKYFFKDLLKLSQLGIDINTSVMNQKY